MNQLEDIRPAVESAARAAGLPTYNRDHHEVGFDGDAWVWTWRRGEDRIAEVAVVARPETVGIDIRVTGGAWMLQQRDVGTTRLFYARYFETIPPAEALASELSPPITRAWQEALEQAEQLPRLKEQRAEFMTRLKDLKLLDDAE